MSDTGPLGDRETVGSKAHRDENSYHEHPWFSNVALLEGGMSEAAVQVGVDISAALLHRPRVRQHQHQRQRLFLLLPLLLHPFLLRLQQLSHQVHSWQLIAMGTAAHSDPGQPWQTHRLVYLHLTESRQRDSGNKSKNLKAFATKIHSFFFLF